MPQLRSKERIRLDRVYEESTRIFILSGRYWNQTRSQCNQTGEPEDHLESKELVALYGIKRGYHVIKEYPLPNPYFIIEEPDFKHAYDLVFFPFGIYAVDYPDPGLAVIVVEIGDLGDNTKHAKTRGPAAERDSINKGKAEKYFKNARYVRINKDDCLYETYACRKIGI